MAGIAPPEQALAQLIRLLVKYPERVACATESNPLGKTIRIGVDGADLGSVIGKRGQTARSLRILLAAISARAECRLMLDISANTAVEPALAELPGRMDGDEGCAALRTDRQTVSL